MNEEWRAVPGFEGLYEVSSLGRVRSLDRVVWCEGPAKGRYPSRKLGRMLRPGRMASGHLSVVLGREAGSVCVHSLVLAAFVGPQPKGSDARHLNGYADDNRVENLEYASRSRNSQDKKWHKHRPSGYKLRPDQIQAIKKALGPYGMGVILAERYGVAGTTISAIKTGRLHSDV